MGVQAREVYWWCGWMGGGEEGGCLSEGKVLVRSELARLPS